jgi:transcription termination/antitermination protein NusG
LERVSEHPPEEDVAEERSRSPEADEASPDETEAEAASPSPDSEAEAEESRPEDAGAEGPADIPVEPEEAAAVLSPERPEPEEPIEDQESGGATVLEEAEPSLEEVADAEGVSTLDVEEPAPETVVEAEPEPVEPAAEAAAEEPAAEEPAAKQPAATQPPAEEPVAVSTDPFSGAGEWYVIHTYAGYENKVKTNLGSRINTMQMQDKIFDVVIPMEDVMEIKGGRKQVVQKKVFPGYLLVKMVYDDDSWYVVRNTPGVTGFVSSGTGQKPTPLSRREVEKILAVKKEEVKPTFRLDFEEGDVVRIISGPFADFNGTIDEINVDQSKVKVLVNIFDRETPVELSFDQVARV